MQGEASLQQNHEVRHSQMAALEMMAQGMFMDRNLAGIGFLEITVRRSHIVEDAIIQLNARSGDLKKPLRVTFLGQDNVREEGLDEGKKLHPLQYRYRLGARFFLRHGRVAGNVCCFVTLLSLSRPLRSLYLLEF